MSTPENSPHHTGPAHRDGTNKYFFTEDDFTQWLDNDGTNGKPLMRWLSPGRMISFGLHTLPVGADGGMHGNEEQMVMILEGKVEFSVNDGKGPDNGVHRRVMGRGDVWYVPPDVHHNCKVLEGPVKVLAVFVPAYTGRTTFPDSDPRSEE
jgi:quercetin dioxygenase-like cupin family protein